MSIKDLIKKKTKPPKEPTSEEPNIPVVSEDEGTGEPTEEEEEGLIEEEEELDNEIKGAEEKLEKLKENAEKLKEPTEEQDPDSSLPDRYKVSKLTDEEIGDTLINLDLRMRAIEEWIIRIKNL